MSTQLAAAGARSPVRHNGLGRLLASFVPAAWQRDEARRLHLAERQGRKEVLLSERHPKVTLEDAYRVQWCGAASRVGHGARVLGHKVGLTCEAMQRQVGIGEPDSGILLSTAAVVNGGTVPVQELRAPRVEAEIAFLLGDDLAGPDVRDADAAAAVSGVCIALEVIDSRFDLEGITLADSVADNAGCARFVLGEVLPAGGPAGLDLAGLDLAGEDVTLCVAGQPVAHGCGAQILGDPVRSVVWLARRLARFGSGLIAGDVVLAGAVHASLPLPRGASVSARSARLGSVMLHAQ